MFFLTILRFYWLWVDFVLFLYLVISEFGILAVVNALQKFKKGARNSKCHLNPKGWKALIIGEKKDIKCTSWTFDSTFRMTCTTQIKAQSTHSHSGSQKYVLKALDVDGAVPLTWQWPLNMNCHWTASGSSLETDFILAKNWALVPLGLFVKGRQSELTTVRALPQWQWKCWNVSRASLFVKDSFKANHELVRSISSGCVCPWILWKSLSLWIPF